MSMGVYINGLEMPETCKLCYLSEFDPGFYAYICKPTGIRIDYDMAKIDRPRTICPLRPVPPHGRLIDADALKDVQQADADFFKGSSDYGEKCRYDEAINAVANIVNAPTIIPAEEGE